MRFFLILFCALFLMPLPVFSDFFADYLKGAFYESYQDYDNAYKQYEKALKEEKLPQLYIKMANIKFIKEQYEEAYLLLVKACSEFPDDSVTFYATGVFAQQMSELQTDVNEYENWLFISQQALKEAVKIEPQEHYFSLLAQVYASLKKYNNAIEIYTQLINEYGSSSYYSARGYVYMEIGHTEEGMQDLLKAAEDNDLQALVKLSEISVNSGNEQVAIEYLERIFLLRPDIVQSGFFLAELYQGRGDYVNALKYYIAIAPYLEDELQLDIISRIGLLSVEVGDLNLAMKAYLDYLSVDESDSKIFYMAGSVAEALNDPVAEQIYLRGIELYPDFSMLKKRLAVYYLVNDYPVKARKAMQGIDDVEKDLDYYLIMGEISLQLEDIDRAIIYYKEGLLENPGNINISIALANVYIENRYVDECIHILLQALEYEPDSPILLNFLGYVYADENMNLDDAERMIDMALKAEPDNYAYLDSKAWVLYRKGKYKDAYKYMKRAYEINSDEDVIVEHMQAIEAKVKK